MWAWAMTDVADLPVTLPRAVLFDWDNTLVDSWGILHASVNVTLTAMGHPPWSEAEARHRVRRSLRDQFPQLFGNRWQEARDIFYSYFESHHLDHLKPLPGALTLLKTLHGLGVYLAVVSNKTGVYLRQEVEALDWSRYFGSIIGATDAEADKPAIAPVELALARSGLPATALAGNRTWFVGDADIDMQCAHAAGCLPVLVGSDHGNDFTNCLPAMRFECCLSLHDLVCRLQYPRDGGR